LGYREHVDPRLDDWRSAVFLDKVIEILDRAAEQLAIHEAIHYGILVERQGKIGNAADTQTIDIFSDSHNHLFKVLGRHSLDIL
jgi:hypothetical protein